MYNICKTSHAITAVEHSLYCNFYHTAEKSLVVAGGNNIKVFRLVPEVQSKAPGTIKKEDEGILLLFTILILGLQIF